jgi:hypothetical protein
MGRHRRAPSWAPLIVGATLYVTALSVFSAYATVVMARG